MLGGGTPLSTRPLQKTASKSFHRFKSGERLAGFHLPHTSERPLFIPIPILDQLIRSIQNSRDFA